MPFVKLSVEQRDDDDAVCPLCREAMQSSEAVVACATCGARQHQACVDEFGGCHPAPPAEGVEVNARARPRGLQLNMLAVIVTLLLVVLAALLPGLAIPDIASPPATPPPPELEPKPQPAPLLEEPSTLTVNERMTGSTLSASTELNQLKFAFGPEGEVSRVILQWAHGSSRASKQLLNQQRSAGEERFEFYVEAIVPSIAEGNPDCQLEISGTIDLRSGRFVGQVSGLLLGGDGELTGTWQPAR